MRRVCVMGEEIDHISLRAHAKLNLALGVGAPIDAPGEPTHGYHPICSYMHAIELFDTIEIVGAVEGTQPRFDIAWAGGDGSTRPVEWRIEQDLMYKAYTALRQHTGRKMPCGITARKSIPAGGGLGGGSSDAASVLIGLNALFGLGLDEAGLVSIAMSIGSDIAYFIDPGHTPPRPAIVSGFGEGIERVGSTHAGREVTLILPPFGCATGEVYRAFDSLCDRALPDETAVRMIASSGVIEDGMVFNDLSRAACLVSGSLDGLRSALEEAIGKPVHMSGSGSTLFVLGRIEHALVHEVASDCRVVHTRLV